MFCVIRAPVSFNFNALRPGRRTVSGGVCLYISLQKEGCAFFVICYYLSRRAAMTNYTAGSLPPRSLKIGYILKPIGGKLIHYKESTI